MKNKKEMRRDDKQQIMNGKTHQMNRIIEIFFTKNLTVCEIRSNLNDSISVQVFKVKS